MGHLITVLGPGEYNQHMIMQTMLRQHILGILITMIIASNAHVTFEPNVIDTGYNLVHLKVPHGTEGEVSTKLIIDVPDGILAVKPERHEWLHTNVIMGPLAKPYSSHGKQVSTGPKRLILEARAEHSGLHNDHLFLLAMQLKIGCDLSSPALPNGNTTVVEGWQGKTATLFWPTRQFTTHEDSVTHHHNASTLSWTGVPVPPANSKDASWGSLKPKPAPYLFIRSWHSCVASKGLVIGGTTIPLSSSPSSTSSSPSLVASESDGKSDSTRLGEGISIAALIMACISLASLVMFAVYVKRSSQDKAAFEAWRRTRTNPVSIMVDADDDSSHASAEAGGGGGGNGNGNGHGHGNIPMKAESSL